MFRGVFFFCRAINKKTSFRDKKLLVLNLLSKNKINILILYIDKYFNIYYYIDKAGKKNYIKIFSNNFINNFKK